MISFPKINQMGQNIAGRCIAKTRFDIVVDVVGDCIHLCKSKGHRIQYLGFAISAVVDQPFNPFKGFGNRFSMSGEIHSIFAGLQTGTGRHKGTKIPIRGRHERRSPPHHVITGENDITKNKTQMIAKVSGCMKGRDRPVVGLQPFAVGNTNVRLKLCIDTFAATDIRRHCKVIHRFAATCVGLAKRENRCIGFFGQGFGKRRMVKVAVGHQNMGDTFTRFQ